MILIPRSGVSLKNMGHALPAQALSTFDLLAGTDLPITPEWIERRIGVKKSLPPNGDADSETRQFADLFQRAAGVDATVGAVAQASVPGAKVSASVGAYAGVGVDDKHFNAEAPQNWMAGVNTPAATEVRVDKP